MSRPIGLVDLPTELLLKIFEYPIPTDTLYSLAFLCRRLHFIALPLYFSRHGVDSIPNSVVIDMRTDRRDVLTALQTALFIPETPNITCFFPHSSCTSIFLLLPHLRRLERFISRLPFVNDVTLRFDTQGSMCLYVGDDQALKDLGGLLNCIVKKRCNSLTIPSVCQFTWASEPAHIERRTASHFEMAIPSGVSRSSHLTSLNIPSANLILPPALHWTLGAIRNCRAMSLTLCRTVAEPEIWSIILPLIASAAPNLTKVALLKAEFIPDLDILDFIAQLPLLEDPTISSHSTAIIQDGNPVAEFRHLETLRAPSNFIQYFLGHPGCLPKLERICISWPGHPMSIDLSVLYSLLASIIHTLDALSLAPELSVSLDTMMYRHASFTPPLRDDLRQCLDRILALEIRVLPFFFTDVGGMGSWIAAFRRVQRVDITLLNFSPRDLTADVMRLVRLVKSTDFLDSISVNGNVYKLVDG
ncbi:hypothetical protein FB451DRAFT_1563333 [Mycena latifolia]|nr:hypothetical protein FB451DRAFT_1563333 [Mycena latifolia]